jgi:hypothetical protein
VTHSSGRVLSGFLVSGFVLSLLGVVLPAWGFHRDPPHFIEAGNYFLSLALGVILAGGVAPRLLARRGIRFLMTFACLLCCVALAWLAVFTPPAAAGWRATGLLVLGMAAGLLNLALFHAMYPCYQADVAGTVNRGGIFYGLGCLAATLLVAGTFSAYTVPSILIFMAVIPGIYAIRLARVPVVAVPAGADVSLRQAIGDFRSPAAVLFALLVFFQFGNEWTIAGWLPLFLIRRVGLSPSTALCILAFFWLCLLVGRLAAVALLPRIRHGRLLGGSVLSAFFGCLILFYTDNAFGAGAGAFFLGAGFASVYPLVAELIGRRFPYYHPAFFNGIFSFAIVGGLLAPATLGYAAASFGVGVVMAIPLLGTCMVVALLFLIWLEAKVTGK